VSTNKPVSIIILGIESDGSWFPAGHYFNSTDRGRARDWLAGVIDSEIGHIAKRNGVTPTDLAKNLLEIPGSPLLEATAKLKLSREEADLMNTITGYPSKGEGRPFNYVNLELAPLCQWALDKALEVSLNYRRERAQQSGLDHEHESPGMTP
jgi:hypothetical protein